MTDLRKEEKWSFFMWQEWAYGKILSSLKMPSETTTSNHFEKDQLVKTMSKNIMVDLDEVWWVGSGVFC